MLSGRECLSDTKNHGKPVTLDAISTTAPSRRSGWKVWYKLQDIWLKTSYISTSWGRLSNNVLWIGNVLRTQYSVESRQCIIISSVILTSHIYICIAVKIMEYSCWCKKFQSFILNYLKYLQINIHRNRYLHGRCQLMLFSGREINPKKLSKNSDLIWIADWR